jgi:hypothetical protein
MKQKLYTFPLIVAFVAISLPLLLGFVKKDVPPNLVGMVINNKKAELSFNSWFSGSYQLEAEDYNNDHWVFKELFVRLNNQFYYKLFNQIRVNSFVSGKSHYVFSEGAIQSYYGDDFCGKEKINEFLRKCKVVQDTLKKKNIDLILVYAPGKGIGASEFIDDKYKKPIGQTNISAFVNESKNRAVNYIDLVDYFHQIKDTSAFPLYARFAHHWTFYFDCLAAKKIIKYIEDLRKTDLPDVSWKTVEISDTARSRDNDVLKSMNLYKNPPQNQPLAYPDMEIENDSLKNTTRVLTLGDSYWYGIVYMGVPTYCFANGQFWYYYKKVIPNPNPEEKTEAWQLDLKQSIESNQVIMIIGSDPALPNFGWGFIDDAYELYTSPATYYARNEKNKQIQYYAKQIRESPLLLKKSTQKSRDLTISLDSAIKYDAIKMAGLSK